MYPIIISAEMFLKGSDVRAFLSGGYVKVREIFTIVEVKSISFSHGMVL